MKRIILLTICCCIATLSTIKAQNEEYKSVASASVGYSLTGALLNAFETTNEHAGTFSVKSIPALQLTYDYGIKKFFSLGVAASYQKFGMDISNYEYTNTSNENIVEDVAADFSRLNVAIRPLFHYANNDKLDMYSGFRVGFVSRNINMDSTDEDFDIGTEEGTRPSFGITAYGIRYFITDNIGAGIEINFGAPYVTCFNLNARF